MPCPGHHIAYPSPTASRAVVFSWLRAFTATRGQRLVREGLLTRPWVGGGRSSRRKARGQCDICPGSTHASFYRRRIIPIREVSWRAHLWVPNTAIKRHIFNTPHLRPLEQLHLSLPISSAPQECRTHTAQALPHRQGQMYCFILTVTRGT